MKTKHLLIVVGLFITMMGYSQQFIGFSDSVAVDTLVKYQIKTGYPNVIVADFSDLTTSGTAYLKGKVDTLKWFIIENTEKTISSDTAIAWFTDYFPIDSVGVYFESVRSDVIHGYQVKK